MSGETPEDMFCHVVAHIQTCRETLSEVLVRARVDLIDFVSIYKPVGRP